MTILSSLRNWRNLSLPCGKLLKLDLDAINRFKEAPFRASPNLYKKCQMWTKSMAIPSPQSSWRISKRYKSRAKIYVNLMRLTKNLCLSIIGRMLGFDNSVSSTMRRNSNENEICIHFTYAVLTTTNKHCLCHSDQILVSKRAIKKVAPFIPVSEKKRLHNKIDPSLQEYFEWLSRNKEDYFAEEHHQPSSSSSWSPTSCGALLHGLRTGKDGINTVGKTTDGQSNGEWNNLEFAFLRSRKRNQTTTSRKLSTTTKSLVSTIFSTELLNLSFALSQKATDVSATGCADTIPTQTYANTHFFSYMHHSAWSAHFQCGNTALAESEKEFVSRVRLHSFPSRLICRCWTSRPLVFLEPYPHLLVLLLKPLRLLPRSVAVEITRAPPLAWVGCLAEWLESIQQQQANHSWQSSHHFFGSLGASPWK